MKFKKHPHREVCGETEQIEWVPHVERFALRFVHDGVARYQFLFLSIRGGSKPINDSRHDAALRLYQRLGISCVSFERAAGLT